MRLTHQPHRLIAFALAALLAACGGCGEEVECRTDGDCPQTEECALNECVPELEDNDGQGQNNDDIELNDDEEDVGTPCCVAGEFYGCQENARTCTFGADPSGCMRVPERDDECPGSSDGPQPPDDDDDDDDGGGGLPLPGG